MDILRAVHQIGGFDHGTCDALLTSRHILLQRGLVKGGSSDADFYFGTVFLITWTCVVVWTTVAVYRRRRAPARRDRGALYYVPVFVAVGVFALIWHAQSLAEYIRTCRALLPGT